MEFEEEAISLLVGFYIQGRNSGEGIENIDVTSAPPINIKDLLKIKNKAERYAEIDKENKGDKIKISHVLKAIATYKKN